MDTGDNIKQAWADVRNDASDTNWYVKCLLGYSLEKNDEIVLVGQGSGSLSELKTQLEDDKILFGVIRVRAVDDHGSKRAKFVFIVFMGSDAPSMRRARASTDKSEFVRFFNGYHIEIYVDNKEDLSEEAITSILHSSAGAHKPQRYEF
ncbi:unnamed protein product [Didymodactylos carnosus]|uniref:Coactosin-like protein n=1 Tax=Didymodactylos carnosus TaxID=1234261 RepID=A0A813SJ41_9BILA|nr:unnamed protein product [Didymodactylos carnosus]CAF1044068.1 unnamed protein product [Didymodactylos carnosus]CAF3580400.1 unnamed protein product [Didymodactylos carnosus]CAF3812218.1 unnamed protein product [Didymodactylos carnosus]